MGLRVVVMPFSAKPEVDVCDGLIVDFHTVSYLLYIFLTLSKFVEVFLVSIVSYLMTDISSIFY